MNVKFCLKSEYLFFDVNLPKTFKNNTVTNVWPYNEHFTSFLGVSFVKILLQCNALVGRAFCILLDG